MANEYIKSKKSRMLSKMVTILLIAIAILAVVMVLLENFVSEPINYSESTFVQLEEPDDDATVVVFETTKGTIRAVLYEDEAPEYCEYFKELVNDGYFDNTYVCAIMKTAEGSEAGFIGGSKTEDGIANDDTNSKMKTIEVSPNLLPIKGSLCSLVKQGGTFTKSKAGSVVTFMNDVTNDEELDKNLEEQGDVNGLGKVTEIFKKYGGVPNYLQQYTVFGQVYDGWEVFDEIATAEITDEGKEDTDDKDYTPKEEIKFKKVYLSTYGKEKENGYNLYDTEAQTEKQ